MQQHIHIVISSPDDLHIPFVQRHLDEPLVVINTRGILTNDTYSYTIYNGKTAIIRQKLQLKNVQSIWYRQAMAIDEEELPVEEGHKTYVYSAIETFNKLIFPQFVEAFWISNYFAIEKAEDKLGQLQVAHKVGMNIPDTVFTASAGDALAFVRKHKKVIAKSLSGSSFGSIVNKERDFPFYGIKVML